LIAHLAADEPLENAAIVCGIYLQEQRRPCCRLLRAEDLELDPAAHDVELDVAAGCELDGGMLSDSAGNLYSLRAPDGSALPELRWHLPDGIASPELVTLRQLTGTLERYQPAVPLTERAITAHRLDQAVSVTVLRAELRRVQESPIVLNRACAERSS
jgi:hypothetical protein